MIYLTFWSNKNPIYDKYKIITCVIIKRLSDILTVPANIHMALWCSWLSRLTSNDTPVSLCSVEPLPGQVHQNQSANK